MKNIAIICEYNPMHNGHIHQIKKIKEIFPDSKIIALMSGSFVQRGEPSVINKFDKAKIAIENGIDLVLEIPAIISLQSADYFSRYCVKILDKINVVDYISFGIEETPDKFLDNINYILNNINTIELVQKKYIEKGNSYKKSFLQALKELNIDNSILSKPNNTLAYLYIKSLREFNSKIQILPIPRTDGGYNSFELDDFEFQSATTIRNEFIKGKDVSSYMPKNSLNKLNYSKQYNIDKFSEIFYYKALIQKYSPNNIAGHENGILNLLINNFNGKLSKSVEKSHNKRYSITRLNRFIFNYILEITDTDINKLDSLNYIYPLKFNSKGSYLLKEIKENSDIEIINDIVRFTKYKQNQRFIDIDINAYKLQNLFENKEIIRLYKEIPFIK